MALLDQYGQPIRGGKRFLDASSNTGNHPPQPVRSEGIKKSVDWWDLTTAVSASRSLYANNGIFRGAIAQKAMFSVGQAWLPIFLGEDKKWGDKAARWLVEQWYPICDVREGAFDFQTCQFLDSVSVSRDGDFGIHFVREKDGFPRTQRIPQHRIKSYAHEPFVSTDGPYKGLPIHQGVIYNDRGAPVAYRVYEDAINPWDARQFEYKDVPVSRFEHVYEPEWYDQGRGLPAFTHGLSAFRSMAQSQEWEELSMLIASAISLVEDNETGQLDPDDPALLIRDEAEGKGGGLQSLTLEGGLIRYFKARSGAGLKQFVNHKPGQEWESFNDRLIRVILLGDNWPYSMVWKPEGGGTDTRASILQARNSVADRQSLLKRPAHRQICFAIACAMEIGVLPRNNEFWRWGFSLPARIGIDDGREQKERRENLRAGLSTLRDDAAAMGNDWRDIRQQRETEVDDLLTRAVRLAKKHKVPLNVPLFMLEQPNQNQQIEMTEEEPAVDTALFVDGQAKDH